MTKAEEICKGVRADLREQAVTLAEAVFALQKKIEQQAPIYEEMPLAQTLTTTQGEKALKNNPLMQEFRGTVRDYASALKALHDILENDKAPAEITQLDEIRARFKVAK